MKIRTAHTVSDIDNFWGNPQVGISHGMYVYPWDRGKGYGTGEHQDRLQQFRNLGYDYVLCTVNAANLPQIKILEKHGWKHLDEYPSTKTNHMVRIYGRSLADFQIQHTNPEQP